MKEKILSLFLSIGIIVLSFGQNVDLSTAKKVAETYFNVGKDKSYKLEAVILNDTNLYSAKKKCKYKSVLLYF